MAAKERITRKATKSKTARKKAMKRASRKPRSKVAPKTARKRSVRSPKESVELRETPVVSYEIVETRVYEEFVDSESEEPEDDSGAA